MTVKCVVFDLDGTIADTIGGIANAINYELEKNGFPIHSKSSYTKLVGHGLKRAFYDALPKSYQNEVSINDPIIEAYVNELSAYYEEHFLFDTGVFDGIYALLSFLESHQIVWGVHTNKKDTIAVAIVNALFNEFNPVGVIGLSDLYPPKPAIEGTRPLIHGFVSEEILFVGDTEVDVETAENLGVKSISVAWGFRDIDALIKLNTTMIYHPLELIDHLL